MSQFELPEGWFNATIQDVAEVKGGKRLPKGKALTDQKTAHAYIRVTDMNNGSIDQSDIRYIDEETYKEISNYFISKDDLYISIAGTIGLVGDIPNELDGANLTENAAKICSLMGVEKHYLKYVLNSLIAKEQFEDKVTSSGQPKLALFRIRDCKFPLPPLAEQQVIADKLDTLLTQVESIKARLERIPEILKQLRQSVLAAAVSGKLTEEWEGYDWQDMTIGEIAKVRTGKTPSRTEEKYWENGVIPWLTSSVTGSEYCFKADEFISELASKECNLKPFPVGTLLLAMYGEGKTRGQVTELKLEATCNQACAAIIPNNEIALTSFVKLKLQENYEAIRLAASGGNQPNLNLNKVREINIQVPTLEVQIKIVQEVEKLLTISEEVNQQVRSALDRVNNLTQSILAKAFRGELTAEWREANPELISGENSAKALLERIKAERASVKPATKRGRGKA